MEGFVAKHVHDYQNGKISRRRLIETLTLAVMSQLRASGNWHRIAREWIFGDPPATELGLAEARFYGLKGYGSAAGSSSPEHRSAGPP